LEGLAMFVKKPMLALSDLKPWAYLLESGIILNKNGSLTAGFTYRGEDLANLTSNDRDNIAHTINQALMMFDDGYIINTDLIRSIQTIQEYSNNHFNNEVAKEIDNERVNNFIDTSYYTSDYVITITFIANISQKSRFAEKFFEEQEDKEFESSLAYILQVFKAKLSEFESLIGNVLNINRLKTVELLSESSEDELCNFLNTTLTCINQKIQIPIGYTLDNFLGNQDFIGGVYPKIGEYYLSIISIDQFPQYTECNILNAIDNLPFELRHCTKFIYSSKEQSEKLIRKQQKLWDSQVTKITDIIFQQITGKTVGRANRDALEMGDDSELALTDARTQASKFGYFSSTIILFDESIDRLAEKTKITVRTIQSLKFNARIEKINAVDSFLGTLPGMNKEFGFKEPILHTFNLANLMHSSSLYVGEKYSPNPFIAKNSPPLALAVTQGSTPFYVNLHVEDVGHTCIVGPIGAGKSTLLAFIMAQYQRYQNAKIFAFDQRLSLFTITKACNGNHYEIGDDASLRFCPLSLVNDASSRGWALDYIISLIEMQGVIVHAGHKQALYNAIESIERQPKRSLSEFMSYVQDQDLKQALKPYTRGGALGDVLDGESNNITINDITTFELQSLLNMGEKNIIAVITFLFYWIEKQLDNSPSLIVLDECWLILMRSWFKDKFVEWLKTLRKMNCIVVFATQSLSDFTENEKLFSNILEACATKIFLPNQNAAQKGNDKLTGLFELYTSFGLNEAQIEIIKHARPKQEYFIKTKQGSRLIDFNLGDIAQAFCCAGVDKVPMIKDLMLEYKDGWQNKYMKQYTNKKI
jgi:type IV secretion system protein TrbE